MAPDAKGLQGSVADPSTSSLLGTPSGTGAPGPSAESEPGRSEGSFETGCHSERTDVGRWDLALSPLKPAEEESGSFLPATLVCGEVGAALSGPCGVFSSGRQRDQVPQLETGQHQGCCDPLASQVGDAECRSSRPDAEVGQQCCLATARLLDENPQPSTVQALSAASGAPSTQKGQRKREASLAFEDLLNEPRGSQMNPRADEFRGLMADLALSNDANWCYINSAWQALVWTVSSHQQFTLGDLGNHHAAMLSSFHHTDELYSLTKQPWFVDVMTSWNAGGRQHDVAEFTSHLVRRLSLVLSQDWERRLMTENGLEVLDHCNEFQPSTLQLDPNTDHDHVTLQELVNRWTAAHGMQTAMALSPDLICIHIDRFAQMTDAETLSKLTTGVGFFPGCSVPCFDTCSDILVAPSFYQVIAAVIHLGNAQNGHYRTLLRCDLRWNARNEFAQWLMTEDRQKPFVTSALPDWVWQNVTLLWLCRDSCANCYPHIWSHGEDRMVQADPPSLLELLAK